MTMVRFAPPPRRTRAGPGPDQHGGRAERDAGQPGDQVQPVDARVDEPHHERPSGRHRQQLRSRIVASGASTANEPGQYRHEEDRQQDPADQTELPERLQLDAVRLANVLEGLALDEVGAVVVAGADPAQRLVLELVPGDAPVVVAVAAAGGEAGGDVGSRTPSSTKARYSSRTRSTGSFDGRQRDRRTTRSANSQRSPGEPARADRPLSPAAPTTATAPAQTAPAASEASRMASAASRRSESAGGRAPRTES